MLLWSIVACTRSSETFLGAWSSGSKSDYDSCRSSAVFSSYETKESSTFRKLCTVMEGGTPGCGSEPSCELGKGRRMLAWLGSHGI